MSKGLGKLQREILEALEEAKIKALDVENLYYNGMGLTWKPGWVFYKGRDVKIPDDVYDLRVTVKFLAKKYGKTYCRGCYVESSFQASFSRAVKSLIKRQILKKLDLVPILEVKPKNNLIYDRILLLKDGLYIWAGKQTRFIHKNTVVWQKFIS
jgi:hypothetical protein